MNNSAAASLDRSFHALAHPVRRAIVRRLAAGPATIGDASRGVGISKPAVTRHVRLLEQAGMVSRAERGRTSVLALQPGALADAGTWIDLHRARWERKLDVVAEFLGDAE